MTDPIDRMLGEAAELPDGPVKLVVLEEAVRLADSRGDVNRAFELREGLMWNALVSGQADKMLVAFSWCLSQSERQPEQFPEADLLWRYSYWVIEELRASPQFSRAQVESALDDLQSRFRRNGWSLRRVFRERCLTSLFMGDLDRAPLWWDQWQRAADDNRDAYDRAYEHDDEVTYKLKVEGDEAGLEHARPILEGRVRSDNVPHNTFGRILIPLLRRGRAQEALDCHVRGYRLIAHRMDYLCKAANHLEFLAVTGNLPAAVRLLERHWSWAETTWEKLRRFLFHLSACFLVRRLRDAGHEAFALNLPAGWDGYRPEGVYDLAELADWLEGQTRPLAEAFDARNGNPHFGQMTLGRCDLLRGMACELPLPTAAERWLMKGGR
jgi:hypothetical protein